MSITPYSSVAPFQISSYFSGSGDIRSIIFDFIGVESDLAICRLVCKDWKEFVQQYIVTVFKIKKHKINALRPNWEELHRNMSPLVRETIDIAEVRKAVYESFDSAVFYRSLKALSKINHPSQSTRDGVIAVMHLLTEEAEINKNGGSIDWKYFRKMLFNRNFVKRLKTITPDDITHNNISRFEAVVGLESITEYAQLYASEEAQNIYLWAVNIVEYKQFRDTLTNEIKNTIVQIKLQNEKEQELKYYETVVQKVKAQVC